MGQWYAFELLLLVNVSAYSCRHPELQAANMQLVNVCPIPFHLVIQLYFGVSSSHRIKCYPDGSRDCASNPYRMASSSISMFICFSVLNLMQ